MKRSADIFEQDLRYGRYVQLMKLVLPAMAASIIAVLALYPVVVQTETGFTLDFAEITDRDDTIRMVSPHYAGADKQGRRFDIKAESAYQHAVEDDAVNLEMIAADVSMKTGAWVALDSLGGIYRPKADLLELTGQVNIFSDFGYEAHSRTMKLDLELGIASSQQPVYGQGPFGVFESGGMEVDIEGDYVHLTEGVSVTVYPRALQ